MRPTFIWNTPSHHWLYFFPLCLTARTPGSPPLPRPSTPFHGFLLLKKLEWFPGPSGVQLAQHVFSPQRASLYPIPPPPICIIRFRLRVESRSLSSDPCGHCARCSVCTAFLVGLGEPPPRISLNCWETPTRSPHCKPRAFPSPRTSGRRGTQSLATRLPSLGDPASCGGSAPGAALPTAASTCPRARAQRPVPSSPPAQRPFLGSESRPR